MKICCVRLAVSYVLWFSTFVAKCLGQNVCSDHSTEMVKREWRKCEAEAGAINENYEIGKDWLKGR